jgi:hypothetical protein
VYAIATQATNRLLSQDFHLQATEKLSVHSKGNILVRDTKTVDVAGHLRIPLAMPRALIGNAFPRTSIIGKQANVTDHDLHAVDLTALLIVPGPRRQSSFDKQLRPFMHVIAENLGAA